MTGDKSVELISLCTDEPLKVDDTAGMRRELAALDTRDILKVHYRQQE